jgi:rubrerythrin
MERDAEYQQSLDDAMDYLRRRASKKTVCGQVEFACASLVIEHQLGRIATAVEGLCRWTMGMETRGNDMKEKVRVCERCGMPWETHWPAQCPHCGGVYSKYVERSELSEAALKEQETYEALKSE